MRGDRHKPAIIFLLVLILMALLYGSEQRQEMRDLTWALLDLGAVVVAVTIIWFAMRKRGL